MTKNQIEYWKNQETQRNNMAIERETNRSNLADEAERNRHNLETEKQGRTSLMQDLQKINNDYHLSLAAQNETIRSNKARETENRRSNQARELENTRGRVESNQLRKREASTAQYGAYTNRYAQQETARANAARENIDLLKLSQSQYISGQQLAETKRSNQAREGETRRSNITNEQLKRQDQLRQNRALDIDTAYKRASISAEIRSQNINLATNLARILSNAQKTVGGKIK